MAKRKSLRSDPCPVARALDVVGERWALLIVRDAFDGMRRFGEFQKSLGVARNILADRLQGLVEEGIFTSRARVGRHGLPGICAHSQGAGAVPGGGGFAPVGRGAAVRSGEAHSTLLEQGQRPRRCAPCRWWPTMAGCCR